MSISLDEQLRLGEVARKAKALREAHKHPNSNAAGQVSHSRDHNQNSVVKSNELSRAYYKVTLNEKRLMELLISRIHPQRNDNDFQNIEISAKLFSETFGVVRQNAFNYLVKAAHGLQDAHIRLESSDGVGDRFSLIGRVIDDSTKAMVTCSIMPWVVPHLIGLQGRFTKYTLKHGAEFKVATTWRIFELLISWSNSKNPLIGTKILSVDEFRKQLKTPESYPFSMFKRRILVAAQDELKELLNINLNIEYIKTSRKVTDLKFTYSEMAQKQLPLEGGSKRK
jgi:plasmid replication initiation protein